MKTDFLNYLVDENTGSETVQAFEALRSASRKALEAAEFPHLKMEEWKYSDLSALETERPRPAGSGALNALTAAVVEKYIFSRMRSHFIVFVNGHFSPEFSGTDKLPEGMIAGSLAKWAEKGHPAIAANLGRADRKGNDLFSHLNGANFRDGAFVYLPENFKADLPVHLMFLSGGGDSLELSAPRNLIVAEKNSSAIIVETYDSLNGRAALTDSVTEIIAGSNASLRHHVLQLKNDRSWYFGSTNVLQQRDSRYQNTWICLGGRGSRNDLNVRLNGRGSECNLYGMYAGEGEQLMDNRTVIEHKVPHASSNQIYKGIMDGRSRGVFNGTIVVEQDAQKTDAHQLNPNLLLTDTAKADSKPRLKIFADDVKCSHGATVGQLDKDAMFYLRSRGIGKDAARSMLTFAFANDIVDTIILGSVRFYLYKLLYHRFGRDWGSAEDFHTEEGGERS